MENCPDRNDNFCLIMGECTRDFECPVGASRWPLAVFVVGYALLILYRFCYGCKIKPKRQLAKELAKQKKEQMNPMGMGMGMPQGFNMQQPMYNAQTGQWNQ